MRFENFLFMEVSSSKFEILQFSWLKKNTGNYLSEMTSNWKRLKTAVSDINSAKLGFRQKKLIFVSKNCTELFVNAQKHFQARLLSLVRIIAEKTQRQTSLRSKVDARQITYPTIMLTIVSNLMKNF